MFKNYKKTIFILMLVLLSFLKISFCHGSYNFFFTGINFLFPLIGSFFSLPLSIFTISLFFIFKKLFLGGIITLGLPTLISSIVFYNFFNKQDTFRFNFFDFLLRVGLPILCMILFVFHPVGRKAFLYSFYWLIPVFFYMKEKYKKNIGVFYMALSATFLAHAVGSIIWIYSINTTFEQWISLIPIVAIERLVFSMGIYLSIVIMKSCCKFNFNNLNLFKNKKCESLF